MRRISTGVQRHEAYLIEGIAASSDSATRIDDPPLTQVVIQNSSNLAAETFYSLLRRCLRLLDHSFRSNTRLSHPREQVQEQVPGLPVLVPGGGAGEFTWALCLRGVADRLTKRETTSKSRLLQLLHPVIQLVTRSIELRLAAASLAEEHVFNRKLEMCGHLLHIIADSVDALNLQLVSSCVDVLDAASISSSIPHAANRSTRFFMHWKHTMLHGTSCSGDQHCGAGCVGIIRHREDICAESKGYR